ARSANGSLIAGGCMRCFRSGAGRSLPDGPQLELERGEVAAHVQCEAAAALELLPQLAAAVELEVVEAGVEGQLSRRRRQRAQRDAGQLQVDEVAQALGR